MAERARLTETQRRVLEALAPLGVWAYAHVSGLEERTGLPTATTVLALHGLDITALVQRRGADQPDSQWWRITIAGLAALSEEPADALTELPVGERRAAVRRRRVGQTELLG